jgi:mannose-1-phosphate guanylyltransferase
MTNRLIWPVILSGGAGSRLWPASRAAYPKQFLPLHSEKSLFEQTLCRFIEVQSGSYLGEDDIMRFDDDFGWANE